MSRLDQIEDVLAEYIAHPTDIRDALAKITTILDVCPDCAVGEHGACDCNPNHCDGIGSSKN